MTRWIYNGSRTINDSQPWTDDYGIQHPSNWHMWTLEEKQAKGLVEVIETQQPDSRLYHWGQNPDGTYTSTPKALDDSIVPGEGSTDRVQKGLRSQFIQQVKQQQQTLLSQTDWAVVRKQDVGTPIPEAVSTFRTAVRAKSQEMRAAISAVSNIQEFEALLESNLLNEWPVAPDI
jgi:hypothetical protein